MVRSRKPPPEDRSSWLKDKGEAPDVMYNATSFLDDLYMKYNKMYDQGKPKIRIKKPPVSYLEEVWAKTNDPCVGLYENTDLTSITYALNNPATRKFKISQYGKSRADETDFGCADKTLLHLCPGQYDAHKYDEIGAEKATRTMSTMRSSSKRFPMHAMYEDDFVPPTPAPTAYNTKIESISRMPRGVKSVFMSGVPRFKQPQDKNPGPGAYESTLQGGPMQPSTIENMGRRHGVFFSSSHLHPADPLNVRIPKDYDWRRQSAQTSGELKRDMSAEVVRKERTIDSAG